MQPNSDQQRGLQVPNSRGSVTPRATRQAATNLVRNQIDKIYDEDQPNEKIATDSTSSTSDNIHKQTHSNQEDIRAEEQNADIQAHWQKYHSAWQQYYQMYYERYYQTAVQKHILDTAVNEAAVPAKKAKEPEILTEEQAVGELRSELLNKVRTQTNKIRKSRHFMPAVVALVVALSFVFLQYNQIILANVMAYTSPASLESNTSFVDPNTDVAVGPEPKLIIPKIAVEAPVIYGLTTLEESVVETKLQSGVVQYPITGANATPGQIGNTVILGHSANDVLVAGNYKFIFLRLDQLQNGDQFYLNYQGKRFTYVVTEKRVIAPTEVNQLVINNGKPMATLVTCTPVGTSKNRLLVIGEQVAPDPTKATAQSTTSDDSAPQQQIGGASKNFFERLFSGN